MLSTIILALLMLGLFIQAVKRDWAILGITDGEGDDDKGESEGASDDKPGAEQDDESDESDDDSESDDSEDESDDDDDEESEGIAKKYFTDPKSLDPKLRADFKKMQGIFTRKMQEIRQLKDEAEAFKVLVADPDFRKWAEARRNGKVKKTANKGRADIDESDDDEVDEEDKPVTMKALKSLLSESKQEEEWRVETNRFKKSHPDWETYKPEILAILKRNPTLPLEDAYYLATRDIDETEKHTQSVKSKKNASASSKPNKTGGKEPTKKGKMTIEQAFDLAKKKLKIG